MYNYVVTRVNSVAVLRIFFCVGVCFGGLFGILLGLVEKDLIGVFGGVFLGFLGGLTSSILGLVYAVIFNLLAPHIGGIPLKLELAAAEPKVLQAPLPISSDPSA